MTQLTPPSPTGYDTLFNLKGQVAVVTGASRGIGQAIAEAMATHGAKLVISSRKIAACEMVADRIRQSGGEAIAIECNVSSRTALQSLVDQAMSHWGQIDTVICNAAVNPYFGPLHKIDDEAYDKTMGTNVQNNLAFFAMVAPQMADRCGGSVTIISSIAGLKATPNLGAYALSKAADMQLARSLAVEWGHANVRVNCIAPGLVRTDMARVLWDDPEKLARAENAYPLGRIGEPSDIAGVAVFLAASAGRFITGQTIVVDGGATIYGGEP